MDRGALVPDDLVITMIVDRMRHHDANHGVLLDGFPRTFAQAQALDRGLDDDGRALTKALYLDVPVDMLLQRAMGRRTCRTCQATYNDRVNAPREQGICDLDGGELYQRDDDRAEVVSERIKVYIQDAGPVVDYYRQRGILGEIDGTLDIERVASDIAGSWGTECVRLRRLPSSGGCLAVPGARPSGRNQDMKYRTSVKPRCERCKIIRRHRAVMIICSNPKHKQKQG